jgi:transcriptional regulator with XRE-family HTH domain
VAFYYSTSQKNLPQKYTPPHFFVLLFTYKTKSMENLKSWRKKYGVSQDRIAFIAKIDRSNFSRIENYDRSAPNHKIDLLQYIDDVAASEIAQRHSEQEIDIVYDDQVAGQLEKARTKLRRVEHQIGQLYPKIESEQAFGRLLVNICEHPLFENSKEYELSYLKHEDLLYDMTIAMQRLHIRKTSLITYIEILEKYNVPNPFASCN